jgi:hypothetical protein
MPPLSKLDADRRTCIVPRMNPVRRVLELVGLKPKERAKRVPFLSGLLKRLRG